MSFWPVVSDRDFGKLELCPRLFSCSEEAVEFSLLVQSVVVYRMAVFGNLLRPTPVAERVRGSAEVFGVCFDLETTIANGHLALSLRERRLLLRGCSNLTSLRRDKQSDKIPRR